MNTPPDPLPPAKAKAPHSVVAQRWAMEPAEDAQAAELARSAHLPQAIAALLTSRGIYTAQEAFDFLNPDWSQLHDPFLMRGMQTAVERLERAIAAQETVLLYGDYDVDGTSAVVLLKTAIEMLGGKVRFHVPHRIREGYGLQSSILESAAADGVKLVITVDTGMRAFAEAETARKLGLDLIITDHHLPESGDATPHALAILNPNQHGCEYPEKSLCGAAIAMKLGIATLARRDAIRTREKTLPSFLKMAAIATIADAVPLRGENRVIAALGLKELSRPAAPGLRALFAVAQLDPTSKQLSGFDVGFRLGPRINAAGRMDVASDVVELFTTRDNARAAALAERLDALNTERREIEATALREIEHRLTMDIELAEDKLLVVDGDAWHRGVIGILASRVVERTAKPALVLSIEDGIAHGSGRSVDGFQLLDAIESCSDVFTRFGGHAFAVGFSLPAERIPELKQRLRQYAAVHLADRVPEHVLRIHGELPLHHITPVLVGWLKKLEPYGHGNYEPVFLARNLRLATAPRIMKEKHIRLELLPEGDRRVAPLKAVGWNLATRASELGLTHGSIVDIAYRVRENEHPQYGGLEVEMTGIKKSSSAD